MTFNPNLLDEKAVARQMGVTVACLRRWRRVGEGPSWTKLVSLVRYRQQDIDDYVMSNMRDVREVA